MNDINHDAEVASNIEIELTTDIVSAYVAKNPLPASELPALIAVIAASIQRLSRNDEVGAEAKKPVPAVPIKKSVTQDYIVSLEDGKKFKSMKRPLMARYGMTPEEYRAKWGLPDDYPMVAPGYSQARSEMAKHLGLGRKAGEQLKPKKRAGKKTA